MPSRRRRATPPLRGLVLAGGCSTRMGEDKGAIAYRGRPHAEYLVELLMPRCVSVSVSVNATQVGREPYIAVPTIVDIGPSCGPASGLLAAYRCDRGSAWLVVAVDLARLDERTLDRLLASRRPGAAATAFEHRDGTLEPLCTVWEPTGLAVLAARVADGDSSARRCLESVDVERVLCPSTPAIASFDSPADRAAIGRRRA